MIKEEYSKTLRTITTGSNVKSFYAILASIYIVYYIDEDYDFCEFVINNLSHLLPIEDETLKKICLYKNQEVMEQVLYIVKNYKG